MSSRRLEVWSRYMRELADLPLVLPAPPEPDTRHALHLYTVLVHEGARPTRDELLDLLVAQGIGTGVHYLSVAEHPYYQDRFGWTPDSVPRATSIGRRTMSLPLSGNLTDDDVDDVIEALHRCLT
jgi:dTDP-4-amino-4,6-dideoxygalactose transaminase